MEMRELRARAHRIAYVLLPLAVFSGIFLPGRTLFWGWAFGLAIGMLGSFLLYRWVTNVTELVSNPPPERFRLKALTMLQGGGVRFALVVGALVLAFKCPEFNLLATGLGLMSFSLIISLVALWDGLRAGEPSSPE
ncbi:MAG: ATP synthase subunit I [Heliobacteriaceae bacterium]|nr:ATP synthase subunit I [Heliobacteriaceae bacterium]MDD4587838.1 ATP synthase subunit I [Heliobacteriaceae bacterium]